MFLYLSSIATSAFLVNIFIDCPKQNLNQLLLKFFATLDIVRHCVDNLIKKRARNPCQQSVVVGQAAMRGCNGGGEKGVRDLRLAHTSLLGRHPDVSKMSQRFCLLRLVRTESLLGSSMLPSLPAGVPHP